VVDVGDEGRRMRLRSRGVVGSFQEPAEVGGESVQVRGVWQTRPLSFWAWSPASLPATDGQLCLPVVAQGCGRRAVLRFAQVKRRSGPGRLIAGTFTRSSKSRRTRACAVVELIGRAATARANWSRGHDLQQASLGRWGRPARR